VPHFPGLNIETLLAQFAEKYPVMEYLPDQKPVMRVPRSFILDVRLAWLTQLQIMRTVATEEFDAYVTHTIAIRQEKIIEKTNQAVEMLPMFAEKLAKSHLVSRKARRALELSEERKSPQHSQAHCTQTETKR